MPAWHLPPVLWMAEPSHFETGQRNAWLTDHRLCMLLLLPTL